MLFVFDLVGLLFCFNLRYLVLTTCKTEKHIGFVVAFLFLRFNCLSTVAEVLLPRGADPNLKGKNGSIPLHLAARKGNEEIVKILLDHPADHVNATDGSGKTALHLACSGGHEKVCRILLNYGANIKAVSEDKMTPLLCAIQSRHTEIARMILSRG